MKREKHFVLTDQYHVKVRDIRDGLGRFCTEWYVYRAGFWNGCHVIAGYAGMPGEPRTCTYAEAKHLAQEALKERIAMKNWNERCEEILRSEDFDSRVADLLNCAARAGDHEQVRLCELALGVGDEATDENAVRDARDECARVLWDNEGK